MSRLMNDVSYMEAASRAVVSIIRNTVATIAIVVYLFLQNWSLALVTIIFYPLFIQPLLILNKMIRKYSQKSQEIIGSLNKNSYETITGIREVKSYAKEVKERRKFVNKNNEVTKILIKRAWVMSLNSPVVEFIAILGLTTLFIIGGMKVLSGEMSSGAFLTFVMGLMTIFQPIRQIGRANSEIQNAKAATIRINKLLNEEEEDRISTEEPNKKFFDGKDEDIHFRDVSFSYEKNGTPIIKNINLTFEAGKKTALVGYSGAGKSTLVNLLLRFYEVDSGEILFGNTSINDYKIKSLRRSIGVVNRMFFYSTTQ